MLVGPMECLHKSGSGEGEALCAQAMVLFQAAAQQGAPAGISWQAYLHLAGLGVPANATAARQLYEAGASIGDGAACYDLGVLLMGEGQGFCPNTLDTVPGVCCSHVALHRTRCLLVLKPCLGVYCVSHVVTCCPYSPASPWLKHLCFMGLHRRRACS